MEAKGEESDHAKFQQSLKFMENLFKTVSDKSISNIKKLMEEIKADLIKENSQLSISEFLSQSLDAQKKTVIHFASSRGDLQIFQYFVEDLKVDHNQTDEEGNNCFFIACQHGHLNIVKYLVDELNQNVNQKRGGSASAIHIATSAGDQIMLEFLLKKRANINQTSQYGSPLNWAFGFQQYDCAEYLLENGANPDGDQATAIPPPIFLAVDFNNQKLFIKLIQHKADVNTTHDGWSILHMCAEKPNTVELLEELVKRGANPDFEKDGKTSMDWAAENGQYQNVAFLRNYTKKVLNEYALNPQNVIQKGQQYVSDHQKADALKDEGNQFFNEGQFEQALVQYNEATLYDRERGVIYSNQAACLIQMEQYKQAIEVCAQAKKIDKAFAQIYFREGEAFSKLDDYLEAAASYWEAWSKDPKNMEYKKLYQNGAILAKQQLQK